MDFKEMVKNDIDQVIFNPMELGETVDFNGQDIIAIKDSAATVQIGGKETQGLMAADLVLYVKAKDLEALITPDMVITVDDKKYRVLNVSGDWVLQIVLQKVVSRSNAYNSGYTGLGRR